MKNKVPIVAVLMSTYNGEEYIREQLDSIFNQRGVEVKLIVRDDGSSDKTLEILNEYAQTHSIFMLQSNGNVGPGESFMRLVYYSQKLQGIDYYAFADQDDIWMEQKLQIAIQFLMQGESEKPKLYCSNQYLYMNGINVGLRFDEAPDLSIQGHISKNKLSGCTMVFNRILAEIVASKELPSKELLKYRMHDALLFLIALVVGEVCYDANSYILYRIHNNNTVGITKETWKRRIRRLLQMDAKNLRMKTAQYILAQYPIINHETAETLHLFASYRKDLKQRLKLMTNGQYTFISGENRLLFIVKVLLGYV